MYKNIIFDLGGVIVDWKPHDYLMERFTHVENEKRVYQVTFGSEEWQLLDKGLITRNEANMRMLANAKKENCVFEVQEVIENWSMILRPRRRVIELANFLKQSGHHIYYLSNIAGDVFERLQNQGVLPAFDGGLASYEVGMCKPEPEFYKQFLRKYNLRAKECIFIDDMLVNVEASCELGITGIRMGSSVNALIRNLRDCNVEFK